MVWKNFSGLPIPQIEKTQLFKVLNQRSICFNDDSDGLIWSKSRGSQYTVKEEYQSLIAGKNDVHDKKFMFCWHDVVLPKVGAFLWLALHNRILTSDRLQRLQILDSFLCILCGKEMENDNHLLLSFVLDEDP